MSFLTMCRFHQQIMREFLYKNLPPKTTKLAFGFEILAPKILYEKRACKMSFPTMTFLWPQVHICDLRALGLNQGSQT
jgi:hypothetical protein